MGLKRKKGEEKPKKKNKKTKKSPSCKAAKKKRGKKSMKAAKPHCKKGVEASVSHERSRNQIMGRTGGSGTASTKRFRYGKGEDYSSFEKAKKASDLWLARLRK